MTAAESTSGGDIQGNVVEAEITCDDWTTVNVNQNKLKLVGMSTKFDSVRFAVASGAVLRVDVPVEMTGDTSQVGLTTAANKFLAVFREGRVVARIVQETYFAVDRWRMAWVYKYERVEKTTKKDD